MYKEKIKQLENVLYIITTIIFCFHLFVNSFDSSKMETLHLNTRI